MKKNFTISGPGQETLPVDLSHEILNRIAKKMSTPHLSLELMCDVPVNIFSVILSVFFHWNPFHMFM